MQEKGQLAAGWLRAGPDSLQDTGREGPVRPLPQSDIARRIVLAEVQAAAADARPALDALAALRAPGVGVIAEVKRRSPSKGALA